MVFGYWTLTLWIPGDTFPIPVLRVDRALIRYSGRLENLYGDSRASGQEKSQRLTGCFLCTKNDFWNWPPKTLMVFGGSEIFLRKKNDIQRIGTTKHLLNALSFLDGPMRVPKLAIFGPCYFMLLHISHEHVPGCKDTSPALLSVCDARHQFQTASWYQIGDWALAVGGIISIVQSRASHTWCWCLLLGAMSGMTFLAGDAVIFLKECLLISYLH